VTQEVQTYHHLIPQIEPRGRAAFSAEVYGDSVKNAEKLSRLPTSELVRILQSRPGDPMAPYMAAVIAGRRAIQGSQAPMNADAELGLGVGQGLGSGGGLIPDPLLGGLSDEELFQRYERLPTR